MTTMIFYVDIIGTLKLKRVKFYINFNDNITHLQYHSDEVCVVTSRPVDVGNTDSHVGSDLDVLHGCLCFLEHFQSLRLLALVCRTSLRSRMSLPIASEENTGHQVNSSVVTPSLSNTFYRAVLN